MCTTRSSSHRGGVWSDPPQFPPWLWAWIWSPSISPLAVGLDLIPLNFPLGYGPGSDPLNFPLSYGPGSDSPQFPPWLWAWIWSPSISTLVVGLVIWGVSTSPPPGPGTPWSRTAPWDQAPPRRRHFPPGADTPPVNRLTPVKTEPSQTTFAGGNNRSSESSGLIIKKLWNAIPIKNLI